MCLHADLCMIVRITHAQLSFLFSPSLLLSPYSFPSASLCTYVNCGDLKFVVVMGCWCVVGGDGGSRRRVRVGSGVRLCWGGRLDRWVDE